MAESTILDLENALADMAGDREIYEEVVAVFLHDTPHTLKEIKNSYDGNDITTLNRLAHSVKSSSRSIGGMRLGAVAEILEDETAKSNISDLEKLITEMNDEFAHLKNELAQQGFLPQLTE